MSYIGVNIKKIRSVKKLNQSEFAELFNLTRASVGSYEEQRAEPKLDTIIRIADYFKISIDKLIKKELTVNELYNFDIFRKELKKSGEIDDQNTSVKYVPENLLKLYPSQHKNNSYLEKLGKIKLPEKISGNQFRAFFHKGNSLYNNGGINHGDTVICSKIKFSQLELQQLVYCVTKKEVISGIVSVSEDQLTLSGYSLNHSKVTINKKDIKELWLIRKKITSEIHPLNAELIKLHALEARIQSLENKKA